MEQENPIEKRMRAKVDARDRLRLIEFVFNLGKTVPEAAKELNIKLRTAYCILKVFEREKRVETKRTGGRKRVFGKDIEREIVSYIETNADATLKEIMNKFIEEKETNPEVVVPSLSTINRITKRNKLSLKTLSRIPVARNTPKTIEARYNFANQSVWFDMSTNFIYVDEMGKNLHTRRRFGRSRVGTSATITVPTQRGNNLSICAAISLRGVIHFRSKFLAYNQHEFVAFLNEMLDRLDKDKKYIVVMDNAMFHHTRLVQEWFDKNRTVCKQMFLPPYSPMLNPIEECFSKVHHSICMARPGINSTLLDAVSAAFGSVTADNCAGWFSHSRAYHQMCLNKQPILKEIDPTYARFEVREIESENENGEEDDEEEIELDEDPLVDPENFN